VGLRGLELLNKRLLRDTSEPGFALLFTGGVFAAAQSFATTHPSVPALSL
jgi:hypothetical protein